MKSQKDKDAMMVMGCISIPIVIILTTVWGGFVLSILWNWFMPVIFGLPELTLVYAMALILVVNYMTGSANKSGASDSEEGPYESLFKAFLVAIFQPLFFLVVGRIVLYFM